MPGIYPAAAVTTVVAGVLWGGILLAIGGRRRLLVLAGLGLPLSAAINLLVKRPVGTGVGRLAGVDPTFELGRPLWYLAVLFLLAPVFEEAVKLAPLALPRVRGRAGGPRGALRLGFALGLGFGLGEIAYLAWAVAQDAALAALPPQAFTGFLSERLAACGVHAMLTAILCSALWQGRALAGYVAASALHGLVNVGAALYQLGLISGTVAGLFLGGALVVVVLVFERVRRVAGQDGTTESRPRILLDVERDAHAGGGVERPP